MSKLDKFVDAFFVTTVLAMVFMIIEVVLIVGVCYMLSKDILVNGSIIGYSLLNGYATAVFIMVWNWLKNKVTKKN